MEFDAVGDLMGDWDTIVLPKYLRLLLGLLFSPAMGRTVEVLARGAERMPSSPSTTSVCRFPPMLAHRLSNH